MSYPKGTYITGVVKGLQSVLAEVVKLQDAQCKDCWRNSTIKNAVVETSSVINEKLKELSKGDKTQKDKSVSELLQRSSMIFEGIYAVLRYAQTEVKETGFSVSYEIDVPSEFTLTGEGVERKYEISYTPPNIDQIIQNVRNATLINSANQIQQIKGSAVEDTEKTPVRELLEFSHSTSTKDHQIKKASKKGVEATPTEPSEKSTKKFNQYESTPSVKPPTAKKPPKKIPSLSDKAKERAVPASRIARVVSFGTLAAGLGVGTVAEITRRTFGLSDSGQSLGKALDNAFITPANAERIVNTLCKVRGAALKIGQIFSIQDSDLVSPEIQKLFERVRQSADFMPTWQVEEVMRKELGDDWKSKFSSFDIKPFAAASIGQVHAGVLPDGREIAIKIQYPGVAKGIESDIDNLMSVLKIWNVFPKGMFIDNVVDVAKRELAWEVDYEREAECTKKFKKLLAPYPEYYVPEVIDELCTSGVFTTELIEGIPVDKCVDLDYATRCHISMMIQSLVLKEMFEFRFMQTDPNWSNFFYNTSTKQLILLDFGASRSYDKKFMDQYLLVVKAAVEKDRKRVLAYSEKMGFLTGYESKIMQDAHVDAVMILGEILCKEGFDFNTQSTVKRIQSLVPTILHHRLCPPPEEVYSLHRKLSGAFLLYTKLKSKLTCYDLFMKIYNEYKFDEK